MESIETVVLVIHLLIAIALVTVVLMQRSEGGALGMGGGGGSAGGGMFSARGTANALTRTTAILAACFMVTSLVLAILSGAGGESSSILDSVPTTQEGAATTDGNAVPLSE